MRRIGLLTIVTVLGWGARAQAHTSTQCTGILFLHGTSDQTNAASDYWDSSFLNESRKHWNYNSATATWSWDGTYLPYRVGNCNFGSNRPWAYNGEPAAAQCAMNEAKALLDSLTACAESSRQIIIYTHSGGSNHVRHAFAKPTLYANASYVRSKTRRLIALAAPHKGTYLADVVNTPGTLANFINGTLDFFGKGDYTNDGTKFIRVAEMKTYNNCADAGEKFCANGTLHPLGGVVSVRNGYGTYPDAAVWDTKTYCGGYLISVGLNLTHRVYLNAYDSYNDLDTRSDGFIPVLSSSYIGTTFRSGRYLNHNQTRRNCQSFPVSVAKTASNYWTVTSCTQNGETDCAVDEAEPAPAADILPSRWDACGFAPAGYVGTDHYDHGCPDSYLDDGVCNWQCFAVYGNDARPVRDADGKITSWVAGTEDCTTSSTSFAFNPSFSGNIDGDADQEVKFVAGLDFRQCPASWVNDGTCDACVLALGFSDGDDCRPGRIGRCYQAVAKLPVAALPGNMKNATLEYKWWDSLSGSQGNGTCELDECTTYPADCTGLCD